MDTKADGPARLLSQEEAATYLGISIWTLRDLIFRGELPCVRIKRRLLLDRQDLETFLERSKIHHRP